MYGIVEVYFAQLQMMDDGGMYRQEKMLPQQRWGGRREDYGEGSRSGIRREDAEQAPKPEYRMLRRPESKESVELPQQFSQMIIGDEIQDEEEDGMFAVFTRIIVMIKECGPSKLIVFGKVI